MDSDRSRLLEVFHQAGLSAQIPCLMRLRLRPEDWLQERSLEEIAERGIEAQLPCLVDDEEDEDEEPTVKIIPLVLEMPDADAYLAARAARENTVPPQQAVLPPIEHRPKPLLRRGALKVDGWGRESARTLH